MAVGVVVALVVGVAAFGVTRAATGDDDGSTAAGDSTVGAGAGAVLDVPTEEVPVLRPIAVGGAVADLALLGAEGEGPDAAATLAPDGELAMSSGSGMLAVATPTAVDEGIPPVLTATTGVPEAAVAPPDGGDEPPGTAPGTTTEIVPTDVDPVEVFGGAPGGTDGVPDFVDPCAGVEPGADPGTEGCPEDGEGGTVIGSFALEGVPPLSVVGYPWPPAEGPDVGSIAQCPPQEVGEGEVPFGITVANPAAVTLTWWSDRDPTVRRQELRTTAAHAADWEAWRDAGMPYRFPYDMPRLCTALTDLQVGDTVHFQIVAVDDAGQVASAADWMSQTHFTWRAPSEETPAPAPDIARVRPPTRLWAVAENELAVIAPVQEGQEVTVLAYPRTAMSDVDPCETREMHAQPGYDQPVYHQLRNSSPIAADVRDAPDYEWDPTYSHTLWDGLRLPSGANVRLCVLRQRVDGPSFDRGYEEVEAFEVSVPELQGFELTLDAVSTREPIAEGDLVLRARPVQPRGILSNPVCWRSLWRSGALMEGTTAIDEELCGGADRWLDGFRLGVVIDVEFADPARDDGADPVTSSLVIPLDLDCDGRCTERPPETYRLELPTVSRANGLCSPGLFESSCEPPRADVVLGTATLTVTYGPGGGNGADDWWLGASEPLGDQRVEQEGPQLDQASPGAQGGTLDDPTWTQELHLDRPATAEAELVPIEVPGEEPYLCLREGAPTVVRSDVAATDHELTFTGLCPNGAYGMIVTLTDADGDVTVWGPRGTEGVTPFYGGYITTDPIELSVSATIEVGPLPGPGNGGYVHAAEGWVGGTSLRWVNEMTGCHPDWRRINANPTTGYAGDTVRLRAVVEASGVRGTEGCWFEHRDGSLAWEGGRTVLQVDMPVDEAVAADEVVLSSGPDDPIPLTVTYRISRRR